MRSASPAPSLAPLPEAGVAALPVPDVLPVQQLEAPAVQIGAHDRAHRDRARLAGESHPGELEAQDQRDLHVSPSDEAEAALAQDLALRHALADQGFHGVAASDVAV